MQGHRKENNSGEAIVGLEGGACTTPKIERVSVGNT